MIKQVSHLACGKAFYFYRTHPKDKGIFQAVHTCGGGGYPIPGSDGVGGTPGTPHPGLDGIPHNPPSGDRSAKRALAIRSGRCASCVHAGGLSCLLCLPWLLLFKTTVLFIASLQSVYDGRLCFSFVCLFITGDSPFPSHNTSTGPRSLTGGYPIQDWMGYPSHPGLDGIPFPLPPIWDWRNPPPSELKLDGTWADYADVGYASWGSPQEDFIVNHYCFFSKSMTLEAVWTVRVIFINW